MRVILSILFLFISLTLSAQFSYDASEEHPFGLPNPEAPQQILDYAPLIGECKCISVNRGPDGVWAEPVDMKWRFKYIMNGMAVQDEGFKTDGSYTGSIRQFIPDSTKWYVHYYSSGKPATVLPSWEGNKNENGDIVLFRKQKAPNGMEGSYKITFYDISEKGFKWLGEWVSKDNKIIFPTWKIECKKMTAEDRSADKEMVMNASRNFSKAFVAGDYDALAAIYSEDGKIFPANSTILQGKKAIKNQFKVPEGSRVISHEILPEEINFIGNYAYDYGYYQGKTEKGNGEILEWRGKYVVIWKKVDGHWKMYLDIWNRVNN